MSEAFDDYRNLVADRDQLLEHNAELRARVAELTADVESRAADCELNYNTILELRKIIAEQDAALSKREAVAVGRLICDGGAWEFVPSASCPMNCDADLYMLSASQRLLSAAPCDVCGYNGPGYYQPSQHPCAASRQAANHAPGCPHASNDQDHPCACGVESQQAAKGEGA